MAEIKGAINGRFTEWCNFCNTLTDHSYGEDEDTIICLDCGLEE